MLVINIPDLWTSDVHRMSPQHTFAYFDLFLVGNLYLWKFLLVFFKLGGRHY